MQPYQIVQTRDPSIRRPEQEGCRELYTETPSQENRTKGTAVRSCDSSFLICDKGANEMTMSALQWKTVSPTKVLGNELVSTCVKWNESCLWLCTKLKSFKAFILDLIFLRVPSLIVSLRVVSFYSVSVLCKKTVCEREGVLWQTCLLRVHAHFMKSRDLFYEHGHFLPYESQPTGLVLLSLGLDLGFPDLHVVNCPSTFQQQWKGVSQPSSLLMTEGGF